MPDDFTAPQPQTNPFNAPQPQTNPSQGAASQDAAAEPPKKPRWPASRIILFSLLAVCLALLGFDYLSGRIPQKQAYNLLTEKLMPEEGHAEISKKFEPVSDVEVHSLLGRAPDATETNPARTPELMEQRGLAPDLVETYRFRGAFRTYVVRVAYLKSAVAVLNSGPSYIMSGLKLATE